MKKLLGLCLSLSLCAASVFAQAGGSAITGAVRDATGAVVTGAKVAVVNESTGLRREINTNDAGLFSAPALVPGAGYAVEVTKSGFTKYSIKDISLAVGQTLDLPIDLKVSASATTVEVTAEAPVVDEAKSGVATEVNQEAIENLPSNGRRVDNFVLGTSPAVSNDGEFGLLTFRGVAMGNSFLTDGNDTTESFYNENAGRTRIGSQLSADAVQEFQVLSDGFSAEFGRAMGGVVNTVTRSGTNTFHGSAYGFWRDHILEALDRYANGIYTPEHRETVGASAGGALTKDKLFYFVNYDYTGRNFPALNRIVNSSLTDALGNYIPASTCTATAAQCTAAINFIQAQMNVQVPRTYAQDLGFAKLDYRPNSKDSFTLDMNLLHWRSPDGIQTQTVLTGGAALGNNGNSTVEDRYGKAGYTRIVNDHAVNDLRFGWFKDRLSDPAASQLWPSTGPVYITVAGSTVGAAQAYPRTYPSENRYQIVDNYSWTHGAHSVKFGADYETTEDWMNQLNNYAGAYSYSNITNFAKDFSGNTTGLKDYSSFTQTFGNPIQDLRTSDLNFYVQDSWHVDSRLTVNYGIRYEKTWVPQPTITNPNWPQTGHIPSPSKNFAPRVSASYRLDDKTAIRAGYGIFFARLHGNLLDTLFLGNGLYQTSISLSPSQAGSPIFPYAVPSATGLPSGSVKLEFASPTFRSPYTQQATLAIDHQIGKTMGISVSYIYTKGVELFTQRDLNLGAPGPTETYTIQNAQGVNVGTYTTPVYVLANRVDTRYSSILQVENGGQSWYNALAIQFTRRLTRGLQFNVAYTWSHAIDTGNEEGASYNISSTFNNSTNPGDYTFDKGTSALDQRHRIGVNFVWSPKLTDSTSMFAKSFINGWNLSSITTLASSHPTTTTINSASTSANGVFSGVTLANSTINGSGGWNRVPFLPVGDLNIDRIYNVDARFGHTYQLGERVRATLSFEAFNAFNTIHNTGVQTAAYSVSSGGILKPVLTNGLSLLGAGNASQGFPDGTNARRAQLALRINF